MDQDELKELNRQAIVEMNNSTGWKLFGKDIEERIQSLKDERNNTLSGTVEQIGLEYIKLTNLITSLEWVLTRSQEMAEPDNA